VTFLVERLADLRQHLRHLREIGPRVRDAEALRRDLSLHNDVLFSLLVVCQAVIDIAGELAGRRGIRFQDYTEAVRALRRIEGMPPDVAARLETLPGFRNVLIHEYVALDYDRVLEALAELDGVERFAAIVAEIEAKEGA
jgi:uncharacterized protein YutE (UPF0331/DUF86 family)